MSSGNSEFLLYLLCSQAQLYSVVVRNHPSHSCKSLCSDVLGSNSVDSNVPPGRALNSRSTSFLSLVAGSFRLAAITHYCFLNNGTSTPPNRLQGRIQDCSLCNSDKVLSSLLMTRARYSVMHQEVFQRLLSLL